MYSTNSTTTTPDDLRGIASGVGRIRRPVTEKQPFSRYSVPASELKAAQALIEARRTARLANAAIQHAGSQPA